MSDASPTTAAPPVRRPGLVFRNAMFLMVAQAVATPLAIVLNAVMARYLGPVEFGYMYLAGTFFSLGFLAIDWGQSGVIPALVAQGTDTPGLVLGSALSWRLSVAPIVYALIAGLCALLGYPYELQIVLALAFIGSLIGSTNAACQDTVRGFERTDVAAINQVLGSAMSVLVLVPVLLLGGRLHAVLVAQAGCSLVVLLVISRAVRSIGVGRLGASWQLVKRLFVRGTPFLVLGVTLVLQPTIDAAFLSRLGSPESVGWHAAARKLIGVLATPASALITALYPTLTRLFVEDQEAFKRTTSDALRAATILVVPLALGCFLYPDIGVQIFSKKTFGPAADNLRYLAPFVFLLYFSMPLGTCLAASGRNKRWAAVQALCLLISVVLDPLLVPRFQAWRGNGGLGICCSTVVSEILMVAVGLTMLPPGILVKNVVKSISLALLAGGAMAAVASLLSGFSPFLGAPCAVLAYLACLLVTGGLDAEQIQTFKTVLARKSRRA